jgi:hypothetical protein
MWMAAGAIVFFYKKNSPPVSKLTMVKICIIVCYHCRLATKRMDGRKKELEILPLYY